ncbi:hypothetical protein AKJ16_DCAP15738 [Drosera capensis]
MASKKAEKPKGTQLFGQGKVAAKPTQVPISFAGLITSRILSIPPANTNSAPKKTAQKAQEPKKKGKGGKPAGKQ